MKQMNQYVLLLNNVAEFAPLPAAPATVVAGFMPKLTAWAQENSADVIRTEAEPQMARISIVCTAEAASRAAQAFADAVSGVRMDKENVITFPDPLPRKLRRPGFSEI